MKTLKQLVQEFKAKRAKKKAKKNSAFKIEPTAKEKAKKEEKVQKFLDDVAKTSSNPDAIRTVQKYRKEQIEKAEAKEEKANESEAGLKDLSEHYDSIVRFFKNGGFYKYDGTREENCISYIDSLYKSAENFIEAIDSDLKKNDKNAPSRAGLLAMINAINEKIESQDKIEMGIEKCKNIQGAFEQASSFSTKGAFLSNGFVKYQMERQSDILSRSVRRMQEVYDYFDKMRKRINNVANRTKGEIKEFLKNSKSVSFEEFNKNEPDLNEPGVSKGKIVNICEAYNLEVKEVVEKLKELLSIGLNSQYKDKGGVRDPIQKVVNDCDYVTKYINGCEDGKVKDEEFYYNYKGKEREGYNYSHHKYGIINSYSTFETLRDSLLNASIFDNYENSFLSNEDVKEYMANQARILDVSIKNLSIVRGKYFKCTRQ